MSFSLPRFLRRVHPIDLQGYFRDRPIRISEPIRWTAKSATLVDSVIAAIEALDEREREKIFEDFERVHQLSDDIGQGALRAFAQHDETLAGRLHSCRGREARGLFCSSRMKRLSIMRSRPHMPNGRAMVAPGAHIAFHLLPSPAGICRILHCSRETSARYSVNSMAPAEN